MGSMKRKEIIKLIKDNPDLANRILHTIPTREERVFRLSYIEGLTQVRIADLIGCSRPWVSKIRTRAVRLVCHASRRYIINNFLWKKNNESI